eukprot:808268-Pelagomonas_calceolata.AAC.1
MMFREVGWLHWGFGLQPGGLTAQPAGLCQPHKKHPAAGHVCTAMQTSPLWFTPNNPPDPH